MGAVANRKAFLGEILGEGYATGSADGRDEFLNTCSALGDVVQALDVRLKRGQTQYPFCEDEVPFHTDHPNVRYVAWFCIAQDHRGGTTLLVDGHDVLDQLPDEVLRDLQEVEVPVPGGRGTRAVLSIARDGFPEIFWLPHFLKMAQPSTPTALWPSVERFAAEVYRAHFSHRSARLRLAPGEFVVVDNARMLHGRGPLPPGSPRHLVRAYVKEAKPKAQISCRLPCRRRV